MTPRLNYARSQDQLVRSAQSTLLDVWHAADGRPDVLLGGFVQVAELHANYGAYIAEDYLYTDYAQRGVRLTPGQVNLGATPLEQVERSGRWALYAGDGFQAAALPRMQGAMTRMVLHGMRDTVLNTTTEVGGRTHTAMARVAEPGACAFCLMLASRGAVYSKDTAGVSEGAQFHDHCRCTAVVARTDGKDLPASSRDAAKQWFEYAGSDELPSSQGFSKWLEAQQQG